MPALAVVVAFALWLRAPRELALGWLAEGSVVEMLTQTLYFALAPAVLLLRHAHDRQWPSWLAVSVVLAGFGAREADLHTAWTAKSVLKLSYYLGNAPWGQKLLAGLAVAAVATAAAWLALRWAKPFWSALTCRQPVAVTVFVFVLTLVASKVFDRSVDILAQDFGVVLSASTRALMTALEELLELSLPALAALAVLQYRGASVEAGAATSAREGSAITCRS